MKRYHWKILNREQLEIWPRLNFLASQGIYLAGGTALALQLGHRTSVDFDFYSQPHFESADLYKQIESVFSKEIERTLMEEDTLFCTVKGVELSFFYYEYPLVRPLEEAEGVLIAGVEDIAAMKLVAIIQRPAKRDYIDVAFLLKRLKLKEMFSLVEDKYPQFNRYLALRALSYFDDVEDKDSKRAIRVFDKSFSWEKAKEEIFEAVKEYQLAMLKR